MSRTVTIYDSLGGNNKALFDLFCQFMCQRAQIVKDGLEKFSSEFKAPPCNKQRHGNSCGVFALMTAKCLVMKSIPQCCDRPMIHFIETSRETQTSDSLGAANISVRLDDFTVKTRTALKWILSICVVSRKYVFVAGSALGSINLRTQQNINKILLCQKHIDLN
ncbi:hypothetical protein DPMN_117675 [Dreissena polymorpha]|uniref:Ubiquitin-like protease family profile domain-containing protein n=1 Tax=Dreissena polymorpha TaxID=45954 RepID=A0A9D4GF42_DREPO|nr:hypothetical protein DPMN_117675 [Dreissena polymorpha]